MNREAILLGLIAGVFLLLIGCAPMPGSSKLVYRSMPEEPRWTKVVPQSRVYKYFVGVSDKRNSLKEAKKAAIGDALSDALAVKGIEVSTRYEKITTDEKDRLLDEITLKGAARLGLELVTWYHEEWQYHYEDVMAKKYRAFVLMRSRKLKKDSIIKGIFTNIGERLDAGWHSMLFPGWGQFCYQKRGKGNFFLLTELGALGGMGFFHYRYEKAQNEYSEIKWMYDNTDDPSEKRELAHDLVTKDEEIKDAKQYRTYFSYVGLGIYTLSLADALLFGPPSEDKFASVRLYKGVFLSAEMRGNLPVIALHIKGSGKKGQVNE